MKNLMLASILLCVVFSLSGQNAQDEATIRSVVKDMATAWTNGNGSEFAAHFAEDHDFFVWNGLYIPNNTKRQNAKAHQRLFETQYKSTNHYAVIDKIRFVTEDVAVVLTMSAVVPKPQTAPEHPQVLWSATMLKKGGSWKIVSFHNADIEILDSAVSRANSPFPTSIMYKNWYETFESKK